MKLSTPPSIPLRLHVSHTRYASLWEEGGAAQAAERARIAPLVETATLECRTALRQLLASQAAGTAAAGGGGAGDDDDEELEDVTAAERGKRDEQRAAATIEIDDDAADENTPPPVPPIAKGKAPATASGAAAVKCEGATA